MKILRQQRYKSKIKSPLDDILKKRFNKILRKNNSETLNDRC